MTIEEMMTSRAVAIAFGLTVLAGLSTGIGSSLAVLTRRTNKRILAVALGFSAGVMLYVSMVEILAKARGALTTDWGDRTAAWLTAASFFGGMLLIGLIDKLIPSYENPHEMHGVEEMESAPPTSGAALAQQGKLHRMGLFTALAIAIHNFPEGLATFTAALRDPVLGLSIAVAIAIHNIPEGIAVAVPIYYATGSRTKAFVYSFLSGLSEPVGAAVGFVILGSFMSDTVFGVLFASVAGIMVFISLDQLLPTAEKFGEHHLAVYGLLGGMAVMALSLLLFL